MMKLFFCMLFLALPLGFLCDKASSRAKRFAGLGLSTAGGRLGCVVSDNKLFVNGRFTKQLSEPEIKELEDYKEELEKFRGAVKVFIEERQKQYRQGTLSQRGPGGPVVDEKPQRIAPKNELKKPEPPKKPSFCSDKATTQYVFDGCSVQGDSVYIGDTFVRKLSPEEQDQLQLFDKEFSAYQKAITGQFRKQVEEIFGKHFGSLFEGSSSAGQSTELANADRQQQEKQAPAPEAPKTPNFCTLIL